MMSLNERNQKVQEFSKYCSIKSRQSNCKLWLKEERDCFEKEIIDGNLNFDMEQNQQQNKIQKGKGKEKEKEKEIREVYGAYSIYRSQLRKFDIESCEFNRDAI